MLQGAVAVRGSRGGSASALSTSGVYLWQMACRGRGLWAAIGGSIALQVLVLYVPFLQCIRDDWRERPRLGVSCCSGQLGLVAQLVVYLCLLILRPFFNVIAWSAVLAITFYPVHEYLVRKTGRAALSAFISSALVVVAFVIPLMFVAGAAIMPVMTGGLWGQKIGVRRNVAFAIRSNRTGTESFLKDVRQAVWSVNSNLPIANVRTVAEIYQRSMARTSFTLVMLAIAASMALLLGLVGIYGVISYSISQRTREIGIRIALGASRQKVQGIFMRQGIVFAGIGVVCGLAAAVPLTRLMSTLLFEVSPLDPATYCAVSAVLVGAALLAAYLPARQATRINRSRRCEPSSNKYH